MDIFSNDNLYGALEFTVLILSQHIILQIWKLKLRYIVSDLTKDFWKLWPNN